MFFGKTTPSPAEPDKHIAVIGTSPLAFFLTDILQLNGCAVTILVSESKLETYSHLSPFTIKTAKFQTRHTNFVFSSALDFSPDFIFLASAPENAALDLLFLTSAVFKIIPLINLSSFYNHKLLPQLTKHKEIRAYFTGQINLEKNTLLLLDKLPKMEIDAVSETVTSVRRLFNETHLNISLATGTSKTIFWEHLAPFFLGNLLLLDGKNSLHEQLIHPDRRQQADVAASELAALAKKDKASLDSSAVLAQLYTFVDEYRSEFATPAGFTRFLSLLPGINPLTTPGLYKLCTAAANKY